MPVVALAAVGIGSSIAGGLMARSAGNRQAQAIETASDRATAEERRQYEQNRADLAPYRNTGYAAIARLSELLGLTPQQAQQLTAGSSYAQPAYNDGGRTSYKDLALDAQGNPLNPDDLGFTPDGGQILPPQQTRPSDFGSLMKDFTAEDFQKEPGYDFRLAEATKAIERSAAARGMTQSGAQLKALTRFSQDFASNEFQNAYNRFDNNRKTKYNLLAGPAGLGLQATTTGVNDGSRTAGNIANITLNSGMAAADARASGYGALASGIMGGAQQGINTYLLGRGGANLIPSAAGGNLPLSSRRGFAGLI